MKKAVVLSGTQPEDTAGAAVHQTLVDELARNDWDVSPFLLHEIDVRRCLGRFGCWLETPGRCVMRDADQVASAMARSDLNVYLTPTTFGEYSSHLKKVLHRSIFLILPFFQKVDRETHHVPRYRDRGDLLVIGLTGQRDPGCDAVFRALAKQNAINMASPRFSVAVTTEQYAADAAQRAIRRFLQDLEVVG